MILLDSLSQTYSRSPSTDTTSPLPPYDSTNSPLIYDEKLRYGDVYHTSPPQDSTIDTGETYAADLPPSFSRVAAVTTDNIAPPFGPMVVSVRGSGRALDKGFSLEPPRSLESPHPFQRRDISEEGWIKFMRDLQDCTALSECTKKKTFLIPVALGLGPAACLVSRAAKNRIRSKKLASAIDLINTWNQDFFAPRRVEVILLRGESALTTTRSNYAESEKVSQDNHPSSEGKKPMKLVVVPL